MENVIGQILRDAEAKIIALTREAVDTNESVNAINVMKLSQEVSSLTRAA